MTYYPTFRHLSMLHLYWNTVNDDPLQDLLQAVMKAPQFGAFRLVGGTSLSLQIGHRMSVDLDLFTDAFYGSVDFAAIDLFFKTHYAYAVTNGGQVGIGTSYFVGASEQDAVKVDLYYTDPFIHPVIVQDGVRRATVEEIIAMKLDVICRGGRKKDFWDVHALTGDYSLTDMLRLHEQRYPYGHDPAEICRKRVDFANADSDFDPICLRGEHWELVKYDLQHWVDRESSGAR